MVAPKSTVKDAATADSAKQSKKASQPESVFKLKNSASTQDTTGSIWARLEATNVKPSKKMTPNQLQNSSASASALGGGLDSDNAHQANQLAAGNKAPGPI